MKNYKAYRHRDTQQTVHNCAFLRHCTSSCIEVSFENKSVIYNTIQDANVEKDRILLPYTVRKYLAIPFYSTVNVKPVNKSTLPTLDTLTVRVLHEQRVEDRLIKIHLLNKYVCPSLQYYLPGKRAPVRLQVDKAGLVSAQTRVTVSTTGIMQLTEENYVEEVLDTWDLSNVGGLHEECNQIFRRAFVSRVFGAAYTQKTGMDHVKGILLHGPPGCGKTLIARELAKLITRVEPKVVNGPELLNKYVGESEANVRRLFADAERDYRQHGDKSPIHILIFDEFDSLARTRGTSSNSQLYDGVVNQILTKMDGKDKLNNIIVIALTNRLDLLDDALLRPGRFEVHIEIGLPAKRDRAEILDIHLRSLEANKSLDTLDKATLVTHMSNFTGAEIASVVRNAVSYATASLVRIQDTKIIKSDAPIRVTQAHLLRAIDATVPRFGKKHFKLPATLWPHLAQTTPSLVDTLVQQQTRKLTRVVVTGKSGTGKTTLVKVMSQKLSEHGYDCVRYTSDYDVLGLSEQAKIQRIRELYEDCLKCDRAVLLMDNVEIILGYNPFLRYISNNLYQLLKTMLTNNSKARHLIVMVTLADDAVLDDLDLLDYFDHVWHLEEDKIVAS